MNWTRGPHDPPPSSTSSRSVWWWIIGALAMLTPGVAAVVIFLPCH